MDGIYSIYLMLVNKLDKLRAELQLILSQNKAQYVKSKWKPLKIFSLYRLNVARENALYNLNSLDKSRPMKNHTPHNTWQSRQSMPFS
jgi:hypothetical protein